MDYDIGHILANWPFDPDDELIVRVIETVNGPKLQMRIDLGVMQMELDGNPSGATPMGFDSWLEYYQTERRLAESGEEETFSLDESACKLLRAEAVHYYYRYLSLMKIGDYQRVIRDTDRNLRAFAFVRRYSDSEMERWALDQYRPYVIMMNSRARAALAVEDNTATGAAAAVGHLNAGIAEIVRFYREYGLDEEMENSIELSIVKTLKDEFLKEVPVTLEDELRSAIRDERFEDAATLRDRINRRHDTEQ